MKNNRGFMLAEVVITSTVVLTSLISLYVVFNKLYKNYNTRVSYYEIDGVYATREMINSLIGSGKIELLSKVSPEAGIDGSIPFFDLIKDGRCNEEYELSFCDSLKNGYSIENLYVIKYNKTSVKELKNSNITNTFKDYLDFVIKYYNITDKVEDNTEETPGDSSEDIVAEGTGESDDFTLNYDTDFYNYLFVIEYKNSENKNYYSSVRLG